MSDPDPRSKVRHWIDGLRERRREPGTALRAGLALLVIALGLRITVAYGFQFLDWKTPDTLRYFAQAQTLLDGGFSDFFPNGYPAIIAFIWSVPGWEQQRWPLHALNVLVSTGTVALTYWIAWKWKRDWWLAIVAGALIALWPNHLRFVPRLLSDLPATFMLVAGVGLLLSRRYVTSGLCFGLGALMRPTLIPIAVVAVGWSLLRDEDARPTLAYLGAAFPVVAMLVFGYTHTGEVRLGSNLTYNVLKSVRTYHAELHAHATPHVNLSTVSALELYVNAAVDRPADFLASRFLAFWQMWGPWATDASRSVLSRVLLGIRIPAFLLGAYGFWICRKDTRAWLIAWPIVGLTLVHMMFFGRPRFTLPTEPFLCVLMGSAVLSLISSNAAPQEDRVDD